jgi:hypothetical protein
VFAGPSSSRSAGSLPRMGSLSRHAVGGLTRRLSPGAADRSGQGFARGLSDLDDPTDPRLSGNGCGARRSSPFPIGCRMRVRPHGSPTQTHQDASRRIAWASSSHCKTRWFC